jgi:hypothetical protein
MSDRIDTLINELADDLDTPGINTIRERAAAQQERRHTAKLAAAAVVALFAAVGAITWLTEPEPTNVATDGQATEPEAENKTPSEPSPVDPAVSAALTESELLNWMTLNSLRPRSDPFVTFHALHGGTSQAGPMQGLGLSLFASATDDGYELVLRTSAGCGPLLQFGLIQFEGTRIQFLPRQSPESIELIFNDANNLCAPIPSELLNDVLFADTFTIYPTTQGLTLAGSSNIIQFQLTDLLGNRIDPIFELPDATNPYVGLTIEEAGALADANGRFWRVAVLDGVTQPARLIFLPDRLNFNVVDSIVIAAPTDAARATPPSE